MDMNLPQPGVHQWLQLREFQGRDLGQADNEYSLSWVCKWPTLNNGIVGCSDLSSFNSSPLTVYLRHILKCFSSLTYLMHPHIVYPSIRASHNPVKKSHPRSEASLANRTMRKDNPDASRADRLLAEIGERLRTARIEAGLTQSELASRIGKRQASISAIENGKMDPSIRDLLHFAFALNKPISYFFPERLIEHPQIDALSPGEAKLLRLAQRLQAEDLHRFIIQVQAIVERDC
jgi:transcriptional regulator with XRE-family HTH domain